MAPLHAVGTDVCFAQQRRISWTLTPGFPIANRLCHRGCKFQSNFGSDAALVKRGKALRAPTAEKARGITGCENAETKLSSERKKTEGVPL